MRVKAGEKRDMEVMEKDEAELIGLFRNLNREGQASVLRYVEKLVEEHTDDSVFITDLNASVRLKKILKNANCTRLGDVSKYSKDAIERFRNMGSKTYEELLDVCRKNDIALYGSEDLNDRENGITFSYIQYAKLFAAGIKNKDDVREKTRKQLWKLTENDENLYMKLSRLKDTL